MRLPIIPPANLNSEQKPLYDDMREGIARNFQGFINVRDDGALLGPWNPWIHEPQFGKPVWELTKAMVSKPSLPPAVREVAILVTGAHFRSAYELYAHVIVAEHRGLSDEKLATIVAGQRPTDPVTEKGCRLRFCLRAGRRRRSAGTDLPRGGRAVWRAWGGGTVLSGRTVLSGVGDLEYVRRPGARVLRTRQS